MYDANKKRLDKDGIEFVMLVLITHHCCFDGFGYLSPRVDDIPYHLNNQHALGEICMYV